MKSSPTGGAFSRGRHANCASLVYVKEVAAIRTAGSLRATDVWTSHVDAKTLIEIGLERRGPCVSMFQSIAGAGDGSDSRALACLVEQAGSLLTRASIGERRAAGILRPARSVIDATQVWESGSHGIAVFASPDMFAVVMTGIGLTTQVVVARRFITRPLLPALEDLTDFEVRSALKTLAAGPREGRVVELESVLSAAHRGRVAELYVDRDSQVWGSYDCDTSKVKPAPAMAPDADDLIDLAAIKTIAHGGRVHVAGQLETGGVKVPVLAVTAPQRSP